MTETQAHELYLGYSENSGNLFSITQDQRRRHIYGIGSTGAGKTTFLQSLVVQDIHAGRGVCLIDPHGDMAEYVASCIPRHRKNSVIYFDASDRDWPIGFNPMSGWHDRDMRELVSSQLVSAFKGLWGESWGEWLEYLLKNTLMALMDDPRAPVSLLSVQRMLSDPVYRDKILKHVTDPVVISFWRNFFERLNNKEQNERISSTLNKAGKLTLSPVLRNIIGQVRSGFDMTEAMNNGQIVIVNLAKGKIGEDNANFLGSMLVADIVGRAMQRAKIAEDARRDFHLYIDEFQNFTTSSFASIVSEARKYRLNLTIAHQNFDQINPRVLSAILKNAGTLAAFSVNFEDAEKLQKSFRPVLAGALSESRTGQFWCRAGGQTELLRGVSPQEQHSVFYGSIERVRRNSRMRYGTKRTIVEVKFSKWWNT